MHLRTLTVLAGLLALSGCNESTPLQKSAPQADMIAKLDEHAKGIQRGNPDASLSVAVVREGKVEFIRLYDKSSRGKTVVGAQEPIFEVASLGKPVFAYLTLKLVDLDILSLERPLYQYAPDLFEGSDPRLKRITARMLLSHTSGLANFDEKDPLKLRFDPGTEFTYSGSGYALLQQVLERRTGLNLETLARIHVFEPLGMSSTSYLWQRAYDYRIRFGYNAEGDRIKDKRKPAIGNAAWSLHTTAGDYARFLVAMMDEAAEPELKERMLQTHKTVTGKIGWSMGWGLQATKPNSSIWHWGSNPGYRSYTVGYPQEDMGIVVLSNNEKLFEKIEPLILHTIGGTLPSYHWF
ncbi:Penicillin-binding protein 4* [Pseudovibrio sp. Ad46]|nr:Penicillin-binding protein 4* [Pseudovibrio sp. Ad46]KZK90974.1 Penicillin-binding protein 4* [Pseudovibrio sp. Ad5]